MLKDNRSTTETKSTVSIVLDQHRCGSHTETTERTQVLLIGHIRASESIKSQLIAYSNPIDQTGAEKGLAWILPPSTT
jgi:hypothetical protein